MYRIYVAIDWCTKHWLKIQQNSFLSLRAFVFISPYLYSSQVILPPPMGGNQYRGYRNIYIFYRNIFIQDPSIDWGTKRWLQIQQRQSMHGQFSVYRKIFRWPRCAWWCIGFQGKYSNNSECWQILKLVTSIHHFSLLHFRMSPPYYIVLHSYASKNYIWSCDSYTQNSS